MSVIGSIGGRIRSLGDTSKGISYLTIAALLYSLIPLSFEAFGSQDAPMTIGAGMVLGCLVGTIAIRRLQGFDKSLTYARTWTALRNRSIDRTGALAGITLVTASVFGYVCFAWSTRYIDTAVSSSMYELWPILWVIMFQIIDRNSFGKSAPSPIPNATRLLLCLGGASVILLVYSTASSGEAGAGQVPVLGVVLGISGPLLGSLASFCFLFADRLLFVERGKHTHLAAATQMTERQMTEAATQIAHIVARWIALPIVIVLAVFENRSLTGWLSMELLGGAISGSVLFATANFFVRRAHTIETRREIISIQYLSPLLSLIWLLTFTRVELVRIDFLVFGTVAVMAINMLINANPESLASGSNQAGTDDRVAQQRHSLQALTVSLLAAGMLIYFRSDMFPSVDFGWTEYGGYWAVLALASTIFTLLLAFRLTRMESLIVSEDQRTFGIVRRIELLPDAIFSAGNKNESRDDLLEWVRLLNRSNNLSSYRRAYNRIHVILQPVADRMSSDDLVLDYDWRREIAEIRAEIDSLAHGRQHARGFAERVAIWLVGSVVVAFCLAVPPQAAAWGRLMTEVFCLMLACIVIYLLFHLADLARSRADELLMSNDPSWPKLGKGLYVRFRAQSDAKWEKIFSGAIVSVVVATVVVMLAWSRLSAA